MTRGNLVLFTDNEESEVLCSTQFNGDMYPRPNDDGDSCGMRAIRGMSEVKTEEEYRAFVEKFNEENYGYKEDLVYNITDDWNDMGNCLYDMEYDYFANWNSDYLYFKNISSITYELETTDGYVVAIKPGGFVVLNFGAFNYKCREVSFGYEVPKLSAHAENAIQEYGWKVSYCDGEVCIENYSPAGEDIFEELPILEFFTGLEEINRNYDPDEHAEIWISHRGERGIPTSIRQLLDDAEEIGDMYNNLCGGLEDYIKENKI